MASTTGQRSSRRTTTAASAERRQEFIDVAASVFYRRGYDSATLGDIAEALDVTKAAVYYYFTSKEDLLYEIIREMHLVNMASLDIAQAGQGGARQRLLQYFEGHARINMEQLEKTTVVYRDLDHLSADKRGSIVELRDTTQAFVRALLEQGVAEGAVCSLADLHLSSIQMFTTVNALHTWYRPAGARKLKSAAAEIADFVVSAVTCTGPQDRTCSRHFRP